MRYLILSALLLALSGCAYIEQRPATSMLTIQYATLKYVGDDAEKRARVVEVATRVKAHLDNATVTLSALDAELRNQIRWERLDAADRLLLDALLVELRASLEKRFHDDVLSHDERVVVHLVADWIIQAAR